VVLTPQGLLFKSAQGWYLLNRKLQLQPVGKPVQAFNADVCTRAITVPNTTYVEALCAAGTPLRYDWFYDSWGEDGQERLGLDAVIGPSGFVTYVNATTGIVQTETPGEYSDAGTGGFAMSVQTSWLKFAGVQGFQVFWKAFIKGFFKGTQPYQVQIAYNYDPTVVDTLVYQPYAGTPASGASGWGVGVWGASQPWGVSGGLVTYPDSLQFRVFPSRIHAEAVQFTITELPPYNTGSTWSLDAMDLEVGLRKGGFKGIGGRGNVG
jgi:hypothetical protein